MIFPARHLHLQVVSQLAMFDDTRRVYAHYIHYSISVYLHDDHHDFPYKSPIFIRCFAWKTHIPGAPCPTGLAQSWTSHCPPPWKHLVFKQRWPRDATGHGIGWNSFNFVASLPQFKRRMLYY